MLPRAVVPVAIITATLCLTVVIGDAAEPILQLALQRADMPATTVKSLRPSPRLMDAEDVAPYRVPGVQGVQYLYAWPPDGATKTNSVPMQWELLGNVYRAADQSGAKRLFAMGKASGGGLSSDAHFRRNAKDVTLPAYGDEQFARVSTDEIGSVHGLLFVRQGTIAWEMLVRGTLTFKPTEPQVVEVLRKYGATQARVAGSGNRP